MKELQLDERNLYGMYPTWHTPFWQKPWFFWTISIALACMIVGCCWLIVCWWRRSKKNETPWQCALRVCKQLQKKTYVTQQDAKQAYCTMTDMLKRYLHERYQFDLLGKTDDEMVAYLKERNVNVELLQDVHAIVDGGLLVKFANQDALHDAIQSHISLCESIIMRTTPTAKND